MTQQDKIAMSVNLDDKLEAQGVNPNPLLVARIVDLHGIGHTLEELVYIYCKTITLSKADHKETDK